MSSGFLLDTSVLWLLVPGRPVTDDPFTGRLREHDDHLFISAVTIAEIEQDIYKLRQPGFPDIAIAATAVVHDLVLMTGNGRHFAPLGVASVDPD